MDRDDRDVTGFAMPAENVVHRRIIDSGVAVSYTHLDVYKRQDFASEEEFLKWKSLSDADYHASEKEDHVYANHTLALDELSEEAASIPAADICMEQAHDRVAEIRRSTQKVTQIRKHLTDTQFRRMWMYFVDGMTIDEIGKVEGVSHQAISLNITAAIRKIKKYF